VRRTIHTGLPRHSTVSFSPGLMALMSTCTGAPAALARSDGAKVLTKGMAVAAAHGASAAGDRDPGASALSTGLSPAASLMDVLWRVERSSGQPGF
jgi:hypothetical protein